MYTEVQAKIKKRMKEFNMSSTDWEVIYLANAVNMDKTFEIKVRGKYEYRVFNLLGTDVELKDSSVKAVGSGLGKFTTNLEFTERMSILGDEEMTAALFDRIKHKSNIFPLNG